MTAATLSECTSPRSQNVEGQPPVSQDLAESANKVLALSPLPDEEGGRQSTGATFGAHALLAKTAYQFQRTVMPGKGLELFAVQAPLQTCAAFPCFHTACMVDPVRPMAIAEGALRSSRIKSGEARAS